MDIDLIFGKHSIVSALLNNKRFDKILYVTEEGLLELKKELKSKQTILESIKVNLLGSHKLQEEAKIIFKKLGLEYQRITSGAFLISSPLYFNDLKWLYDEVITRDKIKILFLDQISDVHNAGAIVRTASFYGVDAIVVPGRSSFGLTPSFYRIASGASESVPLVSTSNMGKAISKLLEMGVDVLALSEHATTSFPATNSSRKLCLVLGKEDSGISHSLLRLISKKVSLTSQGEIKSLNVSVAAAIAMEKCFGLS